MIANKPATRGQIVGGIRWSGTPALGAEGAFLCSHMTDSPFSNWLMPPAPLPQQPTNGLRLHIGGEQVRPGWKILNIQAKPGVDYVGDCKDLSQFADDSVDEIYGSHVYEHLSYLNELPVALREAVRVLRPGGRLLAGVPDLEVLALLMLDPTLTVEQKYFVQRMIMGGQIDDYDYHRAGFTFEIFCAVLKDAGFTHVERVRDFGLFEDITTMHFMGRPISLNVIATK